MDFFMPVRLHTGRGCVSGHSGEIARLGKSAFIVTGGASAARNGSLDDVAGVLGSLGTAFSVFSGIASNPSVASCAEAGRAAREAGADFIIGIGGGSALDAAKAAAVFAANPSLDEPGFYSKNWENPPLPIMLVGTTAGTGSEVTKVSVLTDSSGRKHSIHDEKIYAALSFGDPAYTMSVPQRITLSTGVDVLAHCAESFFSVKANGISRAAAVSGINMLMPPLKAALNGDVLSYEQRAALYDASILGGIAISVTGTVFPHNVGYYLTEKHGIPHGAACAAFLPDMFSHVKRSCPEYFSSFAGSLDDDEGSIVSLAEEIVAGFGIRLTAEEIESALPRWENNGSVKSTVGNVASDEIRSCLMRYAK